MNKEENIIINCNNARPDEIKNAPGAIDPVKDQPAATPQANPGLTAVNMAVIKSAANKQANLNQPIITQESINADTDVLKFEFNGWIINATVSKSHAALLNAPADIRAVAEKMKEWQRKNIIPRSPVRYCGGKNRYAKTIVDEFTQVGAGMTTFIEPFVGGGNVALEVANRYPKIGRIIVNDKDLAVANFWRCVADDSLRHDLVTILRNTKPTLQLRDQCFADLNSTNTLTSGFSFFCINHLHVGGKLNGGCPRDLTANFNMKNLCAKIERIGSRLSGRLEVLNDDFAKVLQRYGNQPHVMLYLDPPYIKNQANFTAAPSLTRIMFGWPMFYQVFRRPGCSLTTTSR